MDWPLLAPGSAVPAGLTAVLSKIGARDTDSDLATAVRTAAVPMFSWTMVFLTGTTGPIGTISGGTCPLLVLPGVVMGVSWLFYFGVLQLGNMNRVAPVDKSSTILIMFLIASILGKGLGGMKILCMALTGISTLLAIQRWEGRAEQPGNSEWPVAVLSPVVFANLTAVLGKTGI